MERQINWASLGEVWNRYPAEVEAAIENVEASRAILLSLGQPGACLPDEPAGGGQ